MDFNMSEILSKAQNKEPSIVNRVDYAKDYYDSTYFDSAMNFILYFDKNYKEAKDILYNKVLKNTNNNDDKDLEAFYTFYLMIKHKIDEACEFIKSLNNRFQADLDRISNKTMNENHCLPFISNRDPFIMKGFNFTNYEFPKVDIFGTFYKDFKDLNFSTLSDYVISSKKAEKIAEIISDKNEIIEEQTATNWIAYFIRDILNEEAPISIAELSNKLYTMYRDNDEQYTSLIVNEEYMERLYERFDNIDKMKNANTSFIKDIIKECHVINEKLLSLAKVSFNRNEKELSTEFFNSQDISVNDNKSRDYIFNALNAFAKNKIEQVIHVLYVYLLTFSSKMDSVICSYKQDVATIDKYNESSDVNIYVAENNEYNYNYYSFIEAMAIIEAGGLNIKARIQSVLNFIKEIWNKFFNAAQDLINTDKGYLEKYKDTILTKKLEGATYTMYNYPEGIKNIASTSVPLFNYSNKQLMDKLVDQETFAEFITSGKNYPVYSSEKEDFGTYCKKIFRGSEEPIKFDDSKLNMTDIYNYCYNYKSMIDKIKTDRTTLENSAKNAESWINSIPATEPQPQNSSAMMIEDVKISNDNDPKGDDSNSVASHMNNIDKDSKEGSEEDTKKSLDTGDKFANRVKIDEANKAIGVYLAIAPKILTAKQTCAEEIYKSYMAIIKDHVGKKTKSTEKKDDSKEADKGTDYSDLSKEEKETVEEVFGKDAKNLSKEEAKEIADDAKKGANSTKKAKVSSAWDLLTKSLASRWAKNKKKNK